MKPEEFYARVFGIGDLDIAEAPWLEVWIEHNRHRLRYSHAQYRWFLMEDSNGPAFGWAQSNP